MQLNQLRNHALVHTLGDKEDKDDTLDNTDKSSDRERVLHLNVHLM